MTIQKSWNLMRMNKAVRHVVRGLVALRASPKKINEDQMQQEYEFKAFVTLLSLPASKVHLL